jgi:hypothetical protein
MSQRIAVPLACLLVAATLLTVQAVVAPPGNADNTGRSLLNVVGYANVVFDSQAQTATLDPTRSRNVAGVTGVSPGEVCFKLNMPTTPVGVLGNDEAGFESVSPTVNPELIDLFGLCPADHQDALVHTQSRRFFIVFYR